MAAAALSAPRGAFAGGAARLQRNSTTSSKRGSTATRRGLSRPISAVVAYPNSLSGKVRNLKRSAHLHNALSQTSRRRARFVTRPVSSSQKLGQLIFLFSFPNCALENTLDRVCALMTLCCLPARFPSLTRNPLPPVLSFDPRVDLLRRGVRCEVRRSGGRQGWDAHG